MRTFNISEALVYLNTILPNSAPKNEETLRRAIRNGELKAEVNPGRVGSKIKEEDLLEYSKKYTKSGIVVSLPRTENPLMKMVLQDKNLTEIPRLLDVMVAVGQRSDLDRISYNIKLLETRNMWDEKRIAIQMNIDQLMIELQKCQDEINAFDVEIGKN
ncbi:MAG: hypothetical protein K0S76_2200 [Herbinix sp.]|nr:hypothetical protein [Herbinix sp.]